MPRPRAVGKIASGKAEDAGQKAEDAGKTSTHAATNPGRCREKRKMPM
jgi:hypothetical protein